LFGLVSEKAEVCTVLSSFKGNCLSAFLVFGLVLFFGMFGFWNSLFEKLLSKLFCVCLSLEKLVNKKQFSINGKHFPVK